VAFEVVGAIGGITQGVARLLGLSKSARLRRTINDHVKLYVTLAGHDELKQAAADVAALIEVQTRQLVLREVVAAHRVYDWGTSAPPSSPPHAVPPPCGGWFRLMSGGNGH
jgi:hypothetical protein